ncbi:hypothetical protein RRF57_000331 [Xylaria bambusicola]|uniref:HMG box domain-containing protein n=1 Tax=Xylaria bambusicola TaxID=326684 RepID=A0AAN7U3E9_9PEZI
MNFLETIFGELGITQYLGAFIDQGFDSWETILDITESDLYAPIVHIAQYPFNANSGPSDALGVKLGHRRVSDLTFPLHSVNCSDLVKKLQRRIANYRGVAPDASLTSPTRTSIEDVRHDSNRTDADRPDVKTGPIVAASKGSFCCTETRLAPPHYGTRAKLTVTIARRACTGTAAVSLQMREDLKGQNLTFTEIAKLVGENWQNLGRAEKEPFEKQANEAKEKYNQAYPSTRRHRNARSTMNTSSSSERDKLLNRKVFSYTANFELEKDAAKRLKTDAESTRGSSTSGVSIGPGGTTSGTGSGSESQHGSEPPPSRQQRLGSIASLSTSTSHVDDSLTSPLFLCQEEAHSGRRRGLSSPHSRNGSIHSVNHRMGWDGQYQPGDVPSSGASWLDSRNVPSMISLSPEVGVPSIYPTQYRPSRSSRSSGSTTNSQTPSLKHEQSSHGSNSSTSPYPPRTPSDASLPIHALLSTKADSPAPSYVQSGPSHPMNGHIPKVSLPLQQTQTQHTQPSRIAGGFHHASHYNSGMPGPIPEQRTNRPPDPPGPLGEILHEATANLPQDTGFVTMTRQSGNGDTGLDGITALLRAREIVDRRP